VDEYRLSSGGVYGHEWAGREGLEKRGDSYGEREGRYETVNEGVDKGVWFI
jgi:hypothetical protein